MTKIKKTLHTELGHSTPDKITVRGMARAIGLVGHILEEIDDPMGVEIWQRVEREAGGPRQH